MWFGKRLVFCSSAPVSGLVDMLASREPALNSHPSQIPGVDGFFRGIRGGIWRDMAGYREIPLDARRYREIRDTGGYGQIRGDAMRCKEIRGDTVRYCRDTSRYRKKTVRTRAAHRRTPRRRARGAPGARTDPRALSGLLTRVDRRERSLSTKAFPPRGAGFFIEPYRVSTQ